jgi:hypothetical protein
MPLQYFFFTRIVFGAVFKSDKRIGESLMERIGVSLIERIGVSLIEKTGVSLTERTNKMRLYSRIYYSSVSQLLNMFLATHHPSSGAQKL